MKNKKFYICDICGNLIEKIEDSGVPVVCCGQNMTELKVQTEDGPYEKHKPVITVSGSAVNVKVGSVAHPMTAEHHILWIYLLTEKGMQRKHLNKLGVPEANFALIEDKAIGAFEYCNLHGIWYTEI